MLVDSHCHLDFPQLSAELDEVVARARRAGVGCMVTICTRVREFERVRAIAERYPDIYCSVGLHPHEASSEPELDAARLLALAGHDKVVGIGETGLDYFYDNSPREVQRARFRTHIKAARESGLPLIVHSRDADEDTASILEEEAGRGRFSGVLHCFSSGHALAERAIALGLYVSFSGILTFKKAEQVRDVARALPLDRLLVETDAPYLAPVPHRGRTNEPAYVVHTAARLADLKEVAPETLAARTTENFLRLFAKVPRPGGAA